MPAQTNCTHADTHREEHTAHPTLQADLASHTYYFGSDGTTASFPGERTNARKEVARETRRR